MILIFLTTISKYVFAQWSFLDGDGVVLRLLSLQNSTNLRVQKNRYLNIDYKKTIHAKID